MTDRILVTAAFLLLVAFLGVFLWRVPRVDLTIVFLITLVMAGYDLFFYSRNDR
jgi:hypothetical protein